MLAVLLTLAGANFGAEVDILAQSKSGKVLCSNPDETTKSCSSITTFSTSADGAVFETTEILLTPGQPLTVTMSTGSQVAGSSYCGAMTLEDIRRGQVRMNGVALAADRNALVLQRLEESMGPLAGKKACDVIRVEKNGLVKYGQIDGVDIELPGKPVLWVSSKDGYKVAPRKLKTEPSR